MSGISTLARTSFVSALVLASAHGSAGDGILGTRTGGVPAASNGQSSPMPFVQMLVAVVIVGVLLKLVMPKVITKLGGRLNARFDSEIKLKESATFAGGTLQIVEVRGKVLLLGVTGQAVNCLADLTDSKPEPAPATFAEILDEAEPIVPVVEPEPVEAPQFVLEESVAPPVDPEITEALRRLQRLSR